MKNPVRDSFFDFFAPTARQIRRADYYAGDSMDTWLSTFDGCEIVRPKPKRYFLNKDWREFPCNRVLVEHELSFPDKNPNLIEVEIVEKEKS